METPVPRLRVTAALPPPPPPRARLLGSARSPRSLLTRRVHGRRRGHGAGAAAEALRAERARAGAAGAPHKGRQLRGPAPPPPPRLSRLCRAPGGASPAVAPRDLEPRAAGPPRWGPGGGGARERGGAGAARAGARRPPRTRRAARPTPTPGGPPGRTRGARPQPAAWAERGEQPVRMRWEPVLTKAPGGWRPLSLQAAAPAGTAVLDGEPGAGEPRGPCTRAGTTAADSLGVPSVTPHRGGGVK